MTSGTPWFADDATTSPRAAGAKKAKARSLIAAVGLFAAVLAVRLIYVSLYAQSVPFWDEWDAEADFLLRPWVQGTWHPIDLFAAHNEHRIAFSRLLSLAVFVANDRQWDNLVEACASTLIYAFSTAVLWFFLCKDVTRTSVRTSMAITILSLAALPFDWENSLIGFQSQFYFLILLAIAALGTVSVECRRPLANGIVVSLLIVGLFTMASGFLAAVAVVAFLLLRACADSSRRIEWTWVVAGCGIAVAGYALIPHLPGSGALGADGAQEFIDALATTLMWPLQGPSSPWPLALRILAACAIWLPSAIWLVGFVRRRRAPAAEFFAAGVAAWVVLQAVAIVHARGHEMTAVSSRYSTILAVGVVVNAWFAIRLLTSAESSPRWWRFRVPAALAFFGVVTCAFAMRARDDFMQLVARSEAMRVQGEHVFAYVTSGDYRNLQQPPFGIPYPDAARLRTLLDDPTIRAILPTTVRAPLRLHADATGFSSERVPAGLAAADGRESFGSYPPIDATRRYASAPIVSTLPWLEFRLAGGRTGRRGLDLNVVAMDEPDGSFRSVTAAREPGMRWLRAHARAPAGPFTIEADDASPTEWFAFTAPVEAGRLSVRTEQLQDAMRRIFHVAGPPPGA